MSEKEHVVFTSSGNRVDAIDLAILRRLHADSRATAREIAAVTGLSTSGALARIHRLEEAGLILRYTIEINPTPFEVWPIFFVELVLTDVGRVVRRDLDSAIAATPEILEACEIVGKCDLLLKVALPSPAHWTAVQARLDPEAKFVAKFRPRIAGRTIKLNSPHPLIMAAAPSADQAG